MIHVPKSRPTPIGVTSQRASFCANTGAAPKVVEGKDYCDKNFVPNWGNNFLPVSQELRDEDKRWADE